MPWHLREPADVGRGRAWPDVTSTLADVDSPGRAPYDPPARGLTPTRTARVRVWFSRFWDWSNVDDPPFIGRMSAPRQDTPASSARGRQDPMPRRVNIPRPPYATTSEVPGLEGEWWW